MTDTTRSFEDFGVEQPIAAALADAGISTPFPIQELTLPLALSGADVIGQARTGTGKTLAFGIPLLQRADADAGYVQALVVVPTRELCLQVTGDLNQAGVRKGVDVVAIYGGRAIEPQEEAIAGGAAVVVGTPGRLLDLTRRGTLDLSRVAGLVLDEADEMLDLGFLPDVERLIEQTAAQRQTLLFSATMPSQVVSLARRYMDKPTFLRADYEQVQVAPETTQHFFSCHRMDKPAVLARILQTPHLERCLVFSRTKRMCDILAEELKGRGVRAAAIHSDLRQEARERAMSRFRDGQIDVLVATEVAARGLDISHVTHVVNYDCPDDEKMYLHRIGRTGRAGASGVAITLTLWNELARLEMIKRALDITTETHEVFSTSPLLDELFDLPPRTGRRAPVADDDAEDPPAPRAAAGGAELAARSGPGPATGRDDDGGRARPGRRRGRRGRSEDAATPAAGRPEPVAVPDVPATPVEIAAEVTPAERGTGPTPARVVTAVAEEIRGRVSRRRRRGRGGADPAEAAAEAPTPVMDAVAEDATPEPVAGPPAHAPVEEQQADDGRRVRVRRRAGSEGRAPVPDAEGDDEVAAVADGRGRESRGAVRHARESDEAARGRGRQARGTPPPARDADEAGAPDEGRGTARPTGADAEDTDDAPVRRRRRTRGEGRGASRTDGTEATAETGATERAGDAQAGRTTERDGADEAGGSERDGRSRGGRTGRGRGDRAPREARGRGEDRGRGRERSDHADRDDRGRRGGGRGGEGRGGESRRAPAASRSRGGRGRTTRGSTAAMEPRQTRAAAAARPDAATARGSGRPMLQRPMLIDHLP